MAIDCAEFEFIANTSTGIQQIASGLGFTPKAYIIIGVMASANATFEAGHALIIGMSDGTTSICGGVLSPDNVGTSTAGRAYSNTVLRLPSTTTPSSAVDAIATHSSFGSGTISINWTDAPSSAWRFYGMAWGGADLQAKVTAHTFGTTSTGVTAYNSVTSFTPSVGFFMCPEESISLPYSATHGCIGFGAAVSTTKRFLMSLNSENAATTTDNWSLLSNSKCVGCLRDATGAYSARAFGDFSSWNATGFSINWEIAPHDTTNHFYSLLMTGGEWDIIQVAKRTTTGDTTLSPAVNTIKGILGFTTNTTQSDAANSTICRASIGLCSSTSLQGGVWSGDLDAQGTAQVCAKRNEDSNFLICATENATHGSSTVTGLASITAMSNTATLNYTTATAVAADIFCVCCGEVSIQDLTREVGDTYNVTDSITRLATRTRSIGDTYNVTDAITRLATRTRTIGDTYNVSDAVARALTLTRLLGDTYNVTDAVTRLATRTKTIGDTYDVTDAVTRAATNIRALADSYNVSDVVARIQTLVRALADTYNVTDSIVRIATMTRALGDTYNVTDAIVRLATRTRTIADSYNVTDAITRAVTNIRAITDSYNVTDAVTKQATRTRTIEDTYDVTDSISVHVSRIRNVSDTYNVTDVLTKTQELTRIITDSYDVTDSITRALTLTRVLIDSFNINDAIARSLETLRILSDSYNVTDALTRLVTFTRLVSDTFDVLDSILRQQSLTRVISDTYDITDAVTRLKATTKSLSDNYNVTESVDRQQELVRDLEDIYDILDSINRQIEFSRSISDSYDINDAVTRFTEVLRQINDNYNVTDSVQREQELVRSIEDTYDVTDSISNLAQIIVDLEEEYEIDDSVERSQELTRAIGDTYNVTDLVTRLVSFARIVSDTYEVNDAIIRQVLFTRLITDTFDVTDEIDTDIEQPGNRIDVELADSYNVEDSISRGIILQRILTEAYNISDSIHVDGGQPPIIIDEHLNIKGGAGGGLGLQPQLDKARKRIIKRVIMDLLPEHFPDEIYIDNQKAWFLNDKLEIKVKEIRFTNDLTIRQNDADSASFRITNSVKTIKEVQDREQLRIAIKQMSTNDYALKQFVNYSIPSKVDIIIKEGLKINNDVKIQPDHISNIAIHNPVTIKDNPHINIVNPLVINTNIGNINIKSPLILKSIDSDIKISNDLQINKNITYNRIYSEVKTNKKTSIKEIKNVLLNKSTATYDKLLSNILRKNYSNTEDKEKLFYYLNYYQTRFDIEKTNTNKNMEKLDNKYSKKLEFYYDTIVNNYQVFNLPEAKEKYGKEIYDIIRSATQNGYNVGIDYVTRATGRDDIYVTQQDLDNVKSASDTSYNHFWDSIEKSIKKKQIIAATKDIPNVEAEHQHEIESLEAAILLMHSLTTGIVALATMDKLFQMGDVLSQQNIIPKFIFATENDVLVCPDCTALDYRLTGIEYTENNYQLLPKPPIHFRCRCRVLLKLGNRIIVK